MKEEACSWRASHTACKAAAVASRGGQSDTAAGSDSAKTTGKTKVPKLPKTFDLKSCRDFAPPAKSAFIWHERQTNRIRASYSIEGSQTSRSQPIDKFGMPACIEWCLRWQWGCHMQCTGESSVHEALNKDPGVHP